MDRPNKNPSYRKKEGKIYIKKISYKKKTGFLEDFPLGLGTSSLFYDFIFFIFRQTTTGAMEEALLN